MTDEAAASTSGRYWLTSAESARYCHVNRVTLYRARIRGDLRAGGTGRAIRFEKAELDRWMRSGGDHAR